MRNGTAPAKIGYCTNVHAGIDLDSAKENLQKYATAAREKARWEGPLGVGLWLAEPAAQQAASHDASLRLRDWLIDHQLDAFTMNGFPQGNFHQAIVKHRVYEPTWYETSRLDYTLNLIRILTVLLPEGGTGSISTLPLGWGTPALSEEQLLQASKHFAVIAAELQRVEESSGKEIVLAIEPEPGCSIGDAASLRRFFKRYLLERPDADCIRRYITVCHDVCHAAVMREDQGRELQSYRELGIRIGKVQVSSAVMVDWDLLRPDERVKAFEQLKGFAEDRYLHQTTVQSGPAGSVRLHEDLPRLLSDCGPANELTGSWSIHFHVPIFLKRFGQLRSTQLEIQNCLNYFSKVPATDDWFTRHWEVETYAWGVLPKELAAENLSDGIAQELVWFGSQLGVARSN